jgi:hypothetical protein
MTGSIGIVDNQRLALTSSEVQILENLAKAGDRAGFYIAYYGMTGNKEALLTASIATFSGYVGGTAYAANWLLNDRYGVDRQPGAPRPDLAPFVTGGGFMPGDNAPFAGMYAISQKIVEQTLAAIKDDLSPGTIEDQNGLGVDGKRDGNTTDSRLFLGAWNAWLGVNNYTMFPGHFLTGNDGIIPGDQSVVSKFLPVNNGLASHQVAPGFDASIRALLYASYFGKQASDFAGPKVAAPDGLSFSLDDAGRVNGVFGGPATSSDIYATVGAIGAQVVLRWIEIKDTIQRDRFGQIIDLGSQAGRIVWLGEQAILLGARAALGLDGYNKLVAAWADELPRYEETLKRMAGVHTDTPIGEIDFSAIRSKLDQFGFTVT